MAQIIVKRGLEANLPTSGLTVGELYFTTDSQKLLIVTSGITMKDITDLNAALMKANNLSDLTDVAAARANLGVYSVVEVDNLIAGLKWKREALVATTENIVLSGVQTIDGIALSIGDRVLVKNQTNIADNGVYVVGAGVWGRATDANTSTNIKQLAIFVADGTINGDSAWVIATNGAINLGVTAIEFVQFSGGGQLTAGALISKVGNTLAFDGMSAADSTGTATGDMMFLYDISTGGYIKASIQDIFNTVSLVIDGGTY